MSFEGIVEAILKEAQERGEFDNLPSKGKRLFYPTKVRFTNYPHPAILPDVEVDFLCSLRVGSLFGTIACGTLDPSRASQRGSFLL